MDFSEVFGSVHDHKKESARRKQQPPKTPIAAFYREKQERITHWCKPCRRWHGPSCFHEIKPSKTGQEKSS